MLKDVYVTKANWLTHGNLPFNRGRFAYCTLNGDLYIHGGENSTDSTLLRIVIPATPTSALLSVIPVSIGGGCFKY